MEKDNKFDEQHAPQKNTDGAYVKVGEDGKPEIPENNKKDVSNEQDKKDGDLDTSNNHR